MSSSSTILASGGIPLGWIDGTEEKEELVLVLLWLLAMCEDKSKGDSVIDDEGGLMVKAASTLLTVTLEKFILDDWWWS